MPHVRASRLIALLSLCALAAAFSEPPTASTRYGSVVGRNANNCSMWLGVRYAAPPVGSLRWRAPQAPTYTAESEATSFGKACPQSGPWGVQTLPTSEDCLFLNVYAPLWATPQSALPVKFWVHGGGFTGGAGIQFNGSALAALTGTVVVTINYRLGIFGFYAIDGLVDESPTLNYGLQDQTFALQWVHDNIAAFGGDPNNITIFGESAGGCSVHLHLWMPMSQGLFHRAIMESPGPWYLYTTEQLTYANQAFLPSPCNKAGLSAKDVLKCMRGLDTQQALATQTMPIPAIDGQQILAQPLTLWATYHRPPNMVPLMVGTNSFEGNLFTWLFLGPTLNVSEQFYESFWVSAMPRYLPPAANVTLLKELYDPIANSSGYFAGISAVYGDMFINCGAWALVSAAAALNEEPVYRYLFEHATTSWLYTPLNATHGAEIPYVWHQDNWAGCNLTESEWSLSQAMLGMWDGFSRAADPGSIWAPYTPQAPAILGLQVGDIAPISDPQYDRGCDFFVSLFTQQP